MNHNPDRRVNMCRSNFRVKVDLSKFFSDVRRFCWIFVDGTKMLQIVHIQEHITNLFNIGKPFHLLLNKDEYLPPSEDIRILKENETIVVFPGSGLYDNLETNTRNVVPPEETCNLFETERPRNSVQRKELQINLPPGPSIPIQKLEFVEKPDRSQNDSSEQMIISHGTDESEGGNNNEIKTIDANLTDDLNITENFLQCPKRRRVRHRKKKIQSMPQVINGKSKSIKPKIINSCVIALGKHIRFDNVDNEEFVEDQPIGSVAVNGSTANMNSPPHELANLLSLGQNSTPLTFENPRVKQEVKKEQMSDEETRPNVSPEKTSDNVTLPKVLDGGKDLLDMDFEACPIMTAKPRMKDVIAFKKLKIGPGYVPQVSDFIVAEVISRCPVTSKYTFKVLKGLTELQELPAGKFTITEDEECPMSDIVTLEYAQIMVPRLVYTSDSDRIVSSDNCNNSQTTDTQVTIQQMAHETFCATKTDSFEPTASYTHTF